MARSYDIAEITTSDGGLPEIVRMKINRNFQRLCKLAATEVPAQIGNATKEMIQNIINAWWPDAKKEVTDYTDDAVDDLKDYVDSQDADVLSDSKEYTDNAVKNKSSLTIGDVYPVGSIYISTVATSPATLFGVGTWEQIEDVFLLGASSTYVAGSSGGEATHTLTINEMPSHNHETRDRMCVAERTGYGLDLSEAFVDRVMVYADTGSYSCLSSSTGGDEAHNNMPPYLAVYMWKRTA